MTVQASPSIPQVLRRAVTLLGEHLTPLSLMAAVVQFPITVLLALTVPASPASLGGSATHEAIRAAAALLQVYPFVGLAQLAMMGAIVVAVADAAAGRLPQPWAAYRRMGMSLGGLWLSGLLMGAGVMLGLFLFVLPGVAALVLWSLMVQVVMLEDRPLGAALGRSAGLVWRHLGPTLALLVVLLMIQAATALVGSLPDLVLSGSAAQVASEAWTALLAITVGLLPIVSLTLYYLDLVDEEAHAAEA